MQIKGFTKEVPKCNKEIKEAIETILIEMKDSINDYFIKKVPDDFLESIIGPIYKITIDFKNKEAIKVFDEKLSNLTKKQSREIKDQERGIGE